MGQGDATRITKVIRQAVNQETKSASKVDFVLGVVAVASGNYADLYLDGNELEASENFRVPAWVTVNVGDPVMAAIDYGSNLGKWIVEVLPLNDYSMIVVNPNTGEIFTGNGSVAPATPFTGGGGDSNLDGGHAGSTYGGTTAIDGGPA